MADPPTRFAPILTSRQRRHPVELPEEPTEEELARDWALSGEDREEARRCRGEPSRLRFAVQLLSSVGRQLPATFLHRGVAIAGRRLEKEVVSPIQPLREMAGDVLGVSG